MKTKQLGLSLLLVNTLGAVIIIYDLTLVSIIMFSLVGGSVLLSMLCKLKTMVGDDSSSNTNNTLELSEEDIKGYYIMMFNLLNDVL